MMLITKLLTNPLAQSQSTADPDDQSPASGPSHHAGQLSMAWKEPERRTWAQSGPNARDWASQNASLIGGGYFIYARFRPIDRSPPIWGSKSHEFKPRQPDRAAAVHAGPGLTSREQRATHPHDRDSLVCNLLNSI
jgi:hypothetical protein